MMKLGVVFPQTEIGADPGVIKAYAQTAEGLGYDYLLVFDHVLGANPNRPGGWQGPYIHESMFHEPFVLFGYLAGLTQRLELVTGVIILPQRQTALVAKQAAEVDVLSGGRLRLGVGLGWNQVEYESLESNFKNRGKRIEEQVTLMRELWTKPLVNFKGKYHSIPDAGLNPLPVQRPIPIWFGGRAEAALKRMARLGDGWLANDQPGETLKAQFDQLQRYLEAEGRSPESFGIDGRISMSTYPASEWGRQLKLWQELGVTHLSINTMRAGLSSPQAHIETIRQFKQIADETLGY
jgi:probable F420-dependent oxidoreductase